MAKASAGEGTRHPKDFRTQFGASDVIALAPPDAPTGKRLNLLLPGISARRAYGGVATALRLVEALASGFDHTRLVITAETASECEPHRWSSWASDSNGLARRSIVFLGDRVTPLALAATDYFVATAWPTALYCGYLISVQEQLFQEAKRRFVYFVQDYEPGFYSHSISYAYAESTYWDYPDAIAVFNSSQLAKFFAEEQYTFSREYIYEPMMNPVLRERRVAKRTPFKERMIFIYARPSIPRNGFQAIVEALKIWARTLPSAQEWSVVSDGDPHEDIDLGNGVSLVSRGRLTLDEYADCLSRCWVGVSLVFSPHPGYTVLEMAELGSWVITNKWKGKDPSRLAPNILAVNLPSPEAIAAQLLWSCERFEPGLESVVPDLPSVLRSEGAEFPFLSELLAVWCGAR